MSWFTLPSLLIATCVISLVLFRRAVTFMVDSVCHIIQDTISEFQPDVLMGSSFGGAIAAIILSRQVWQGPTVLLCPATHRVLAYMGSSLTRHPLPPKSSVLIIHGTSDDTVPIEHSRKLLSLFQRMMMPDRQQACRLIEVEDDHRLAKAATESEMQRWIEEAVAMC